MVAYNLVIRRGTRGLLGPVLDGTKPAGDVSHIPSSRLPFRNLGFFKIQNLTVDGVESVSMSRHAKFHGDRSNRQGLPLPFQFQSVITLDRYHFILLREQR